MTVPDRDVADMLDGRWPGYSEQSWSERFAELDRRHKRDTERLQKVLEGYLTTQAAALKEAREAGFREGVEEAAKVATVEGAILGCKKYRTRNLGLPRDAYPSEISNGIAAAIRAIPTED